ncbi:MAG: ABC transporter ATP-binding protein [Candidatus Methanoperedens sp.]|nr:ABC transporter ATP-binding protein [Candidatus Methanoperedens sp.]
MKSSNTPQPVVQFNHVSFMRDDNTILQDISFRIEKGQHWAIIGPNGSGKTSLVSIINGYHQPSKGIVEVLGRTFGRTDLRELRLHIGEASSEIKNMLHSQDTVTDIVLSGRFATIGLYEKPSQEDLETAGRLIDFFDLCELASRPFNILSSGEQQKTLLARALMPNPDLLVLDEPCAGLDLGAREELLNTVQKMCEFPEGPTIIFVTHHIEELVPAVSHVLALREGKIVAQGTKMEVLTGEVLSRTFDLKIEVNERGGRLWAMIL